MSLLKEETLIYIKVYNNITYILGVPSQTSHPETMQFMLFDKLINKYFGCLPLLKFCHTSRFS